MKFHLIDHVESISDVKIVAVKQVSLAEEYLADHFPTFPVLPGVMMLEAGVQACAWLLHQKSGFAKSMAVLKEAKNVKYGNFVAPGRRLTVTAELAASGAYHGFKVVGMVSDGMSEPKTAFTARLDIAYFNLAERQPELAGVDAKLIEHARKRWQILEQMRPVSI